jgi:hypothetical protein
VPGIPEPPLSLSSRKYFQESSMPVILWLLGVPLGLVLLLMLFGVL